MASNTDHLLNPSVRKKRSSKTGGTEKEELALQPIVIRHMKPTCWSRRKEETATEEGKGGKELSALWRSRACNHRGHVLGAPHCDRVPDQGGPKKWGSRLGGNDMPEVIEVANWRWRWWWEESHHWPHSGAAVGHRPTRSPGLLLCSHLRSHLCKSLSARFEAYPGWLGIFLFCLSCE